MKSPLRHAWWETPIGLIVLWMLAEEFGSSVPWGFVVGLVGLLVVALALGVSFYVFGKRSD